jgi:hypothetical protein
VLALSAARPLVRGIAGAGVARIDPAHAQAAAATRLVAARGLAPGTSATTYYTNGDAAAFESAVRRWTGDATGRVAALAVSS